jgi:hypothetical protein
MIDALASFDCRLPFDALSSCRITCRRVFALVDRIVGLLLIVVVLVVAAIVRRNVAIFDGAPLIEHSEGSNSEARTLFLSTSSTSFDDV